jgi:sporulation related protein
MSTHDSGRGRKAGPTPELQSDFANRQSAGPAPQTWGANALSTQKSEVAFMGQGAGRPGQPIAGQRSIFGGNGPVFAQMPSYTPVTRGPAPQAPEPPQQPSFSPYQASQPAPQTFQNPFAPQPPQHAPQPAPAPAPAFANLQTAAPSYQQPDFQPQGYRTNQAQSAPSFAPPEHPGAQSYPGASYNGAQGYANQSYQPQGYPDASYGDASFPETGSQDASYGEQSFGKQNFGDASFGDASFGDASFEESSFSDSNFGASNSPFGNLEQGLDGGFGSQQPHAQADHGFDTFGEEATQDYVMASQGGSGHVPPSDPRRQLQAFDALYDQPPQIALGPTEPSRRPAQDFFESERVDADFLDEGQVTPPPSARSKMATLRSRSAFMVGSALLGAIALGGALAFVYKQSGGGIGSEQPPIVTADARPVKELPDQPGGKEFPHKNKLIYDRLQNGDEPEAEKLVPRQEDVAVPALPPAQSETAGLPTPVATTDLTPPPTTQAVDNPGMPAGAAPMAVASADDTAEGGPRRVKTLKVRPDGSVEEPPAAAADPAAAQASAAADTATAALPAAAPAPAEAMPVPAAATPAPAAAPAPQQVAAVPPAPVKPKAKPAATQASATPAAAPAAAGSTKYVVQVGSKKNQTEALASFADMQQKYPSLLASYRPMVQKADLGAKGVWYRLRIGPIADKTAAAKLCSQLKAQGLPDCLVATQ